MSIRLSYSSSCSSMFSPSLRVTSRSSPAASRGLSRLRRRLVWRPLRLGGLLLASVGTLACHDLSGLAGQHALPAGTPDPSVYHTAAGAIALYQMTVDAFQYTYGDTTTSLGGTTTGTGAGAFVDYVLESGLFTDELQAGNLGCTGVLCNSATAQQLKDARAIPPEGSSGDETFILLQGIRNDATVAIGALQAYAATASPALQGHLHALAGFAELFLADFYCSGVPLSTLNGTGGFTYAPGSTTRQVNQAALAQFDTAISVSSDSERILNLAWVGKARALLALDSFPQAAQAAAHVPDGFAYQFLVDWRIQVRNKGESDHFFGPGGIYAYTESDQEGVTGLPYRSSGDPRTVAQVASTNPYGQPQYWPVKYGGATPGILPMAVADGIEARLIQAEAALHPPTSDVSTFLAQLNAARAVAAPSLPPLTADSVPSTDSGRVTLLFRERAYDLFLTGHRQGDLRRLIRQYSRSPAQIYPSGPYPGGRPSIYGSEVTVPISTVDEAPNPLFHGCLSGA